MDELTTVRDAMRRFSDERGWRKYHDPKSLALALVGEVGELAELLQWLPADDVTRLATEEPLRTRLGEELSDVLLYLVRLADVLDVDLPAAAARKMKLNETKYVRSEGAAPTS